LRSNHTHHSELYEKGIHDPTTLLDAFEERAAIIQYEGYITPKAKAEQAAAESYGFGCVTALILFAENWNMETHYE